MRVVKLALSAVLILEWYWVGTMDSWKVDLMVEIVVDSKAEWMGHSRVASMVFELAWLTADCSVGMMVEK